MKTFVLALMVLLSVGSLAIAAEAPAPTQTGKEAKQEDSKGPAKAPVLTKSQAEALESLGLSTTKFMKFGVRKDADKEETKR